MCIRDRDGDGEAGTSKLPNAGQIDDDDCRKWMVFIDLMRKSYSSTTLCCTEIRTAVFSKVEIDKNYLEGGWTLNCYFH